MQEVVWRVFRRTKLILLLLEEGKKVDAAFKTAMLTSRPRAIVFVSRIVTPTLFYHEQSLLSNVVFLKVY